MSPHLFYLILIAATGSQLDAFQRVVNCQHSRPRLITSELSFTPAKDGVDDSIDTKIEMLQVADASLNVLLENMPLAEKYAVLLQSYATDIIDNTNRTIAALDTMDLLFTEMLSKSIAPSEKASKLLIDASSTFCSSIKLGKSLQLAKAGGTCKAFGVANGQLSDPIIAASSSTLSKDSAVPYDDREQEVLYAGLVAAISTTWISFEVTQNFINDLHPWTTLLGVAAIGLCALDVAIRQGKGIKLASAGVERLVLKDAERQTHSDGAAFLVGYLVGLPCFCFRPDVTEALKMLRDDPQGLDFYRQPKAQGLTTAGKTSSSATATSSSAKSVSNDLIGGAIQSIFGKAKPSKTITAVPSEKEKITSNVRSTYSLPSIPVQRAGFGAPGGGDIQGLSRVLVWLMAPVAAEYLKYGRTVVSDPRRALKLLSVLEQIQITDESSGNTLFGGKQAASTDSTTDVLYTIPADTEDKKALLQWAFYESTSLIKRYGDLLEDVNSYLATGTSTVGECVLMVEEEMR